MRLAWLASIVLLISAILSDAASAASSNALAVTLVVHVAARIQLQAQSPTASGQWPTCRAPVKTGSRYKSPWMGPTLLS